MRAMPGTSPRRGSATGRLRRPVCLYDRCVQALVFTRPGTVEVLDVPEPEAGPGEILVDVAAAGICGSELHGIQTPGFRQPPLVMGHEFSGTAPDGRRVTVNPVVDCTTCDLCRMGLTQLCRTRSIIGI